MSETDLPCTYRFYYALTSFGQFWRELNYHPLLTKLDAREHVRMRSFITPDSSRTRMLICASTFQKEVLDEDRRRTVSDEAKRLYTQEPDLFAAGNKEYQGRLTLSPRFLQNHTLTRRNEVPIPTLIHLISELPKDARLHDLTSLMAIDSKKLNPEELGEDIIKQQQAANLKHSSSSCAIIPEDQAQTMLAGVRLFLAFRRTYFFTSSHTRIRTWFLNVSTLISGHANAPNFWGVGDPQPPVTARRTKTHKRYHLWHRHN